MGLRWAAGGCRSGAQEGQALPLGLMLLTAVAAILFFMFNSGQLVQEKIRLTNTADAVAYSAGVFEARLLNYDAYINRAIIANEIAIGHAVGLAGWLTYGAKASEHIAPYVAMLPGGPAIAAALAEVAKGLETSYAPPLANSVVRHQMALDGLGKAWLSTHGPGNSIALATRETLMDEVAKRNDPDAKVDILPLADDFAGFTRRYSTREERRRMGQLVHEARDAFLQSRNWDVGVVVLCVGVKLKKRGSTEFIDMVDGWKSMDTLSAHLYSFHKLKCKHSEDPVGWGTAASLGGLDDSAYDYAGSTGTNPDASALAQDNSAPGFPPKTIWSGAIPPFYELSETALKAEDPRTVLAIRVTKARTAQRFSGGASTIKPQGSLELYQGAHAGGESAAVAKVEVFFARPDGKNPLFQREELGSLFNPYWQPRLAPLTAGERALAQLRQGVLLP